MRSLRVIFNVGFTSTSMLARRPGLEHSLQGEQLPEQSAHPNSQSPSVDCIRSVDRVWS